MNITTIFALALMLTAPISELEYHHTEVGYDRFNCQDFTALAVTDLKSHGIEAYPYCGWFPNHQRHSYVGVVKNGTVKYFEPQTNKEMQPLRFNMRCVARGITGYEDWL